MAGHHFISYSGADARDFAFQLHDALEAGPPHVPAWLDRRDITPGQDWDEEIVEAIRTCVSLLFIMSEDSVGKKSVCKDEWTRALRYKKPIVPLLYQRGVVPPFRLENRQHIDFTGNFDQALARLRNHLGWLDLPAGKLKELEDRLADARRDLRRARSPEEEARAQDDVKQLEAQIEAQQRIVADPEAAKKRTEERIASGIERERQPSQPVGGVSRTKFLNPPPAVAPSYFQNRYVETQLIGDFLKDEAKRLMTIVGRAGIGKTATVCRILKALEGRSLPDDLGPMDVDGIIYLSAIGSRRVNAPNLYEDLLKLLPEEAARRVASVVRDSKTTTDAKMRALLESFPNGRTLVLLDNFEDVIDPATHNIADAELDEALRALVNLPHHGVKVILTTRVAPRALILVQPGRQLRLDLDSGLESPHAENILREMDADGKLGLKSATDERLALARERTRGFPRALEALFAILSADRDTTLEEILAGTSTPLPENVTEALVGEAFSRLDPAQQPVVQALAVYGRPVPPAAVDYLLQPFLPGVDTAPVLGRLVNMHFARKEAGRYYLHPVDREYVLGRIVSGEPSDRKAAAPVFSRHGLLHRAAEYFKQVRLPREDWTKIEDVAPQLAEFDLRCEDQDYETAADVLLEISSDYLMRWGWSRRVVELSARLLGKLDNPRLGSSLLADRGLAYLDLGEPKRAIVYCKQALAMAREVDDRRKLGIILGHMGRCHRHMGQAARAIDYHELALAFAREADDPLNEASALGHLGSCYKNIGETRRSIACHERALTIEREIGDPRGEAITLGALGLCHIDLGQTAQAIDHLEQALAIARQIGDQRREGISLSSLGRCYRVLGQVARGIDHLEQALAISREVSDRRGDGISLSHIGFCYIDLGRIAPAVDYLEQALAIMREVGDRLGEGYSLFHLARLFLDEGRREDAIPQAMDAVRIGVEACDPNLISHGNGALALARFWLGDLRAARAAAEAARVHDVPRNNHNVLVLLGLIALRRGDRSASAEAFRAAVSHADVMLERCNQNYNALDAKGLALAGLAVIEGGDRAADAIAAFRAARAITSAAGIVGRVKRLLDAMAAADAAGILAPVTRAAEGLEGAVEN